MMNHLPSLAWLTLLVCGTSTAAGLDGAYLRIAGGVTKMEDQKHGYANGVNLTNQLDDGNAASAALGFRFNDYWRADLSIDRADNDNDMVSINGVRDGSTGGDLRYQALLMNVFYDFTLDTYSKWHPYVGTGLGLTRLKWTLTDTSTTATAKADKTTFHGTVGVGYQFDLNWRLNVNYRRIETSPYASQTGAGVSGTTTPKYRNNNMNVEIMFIL